MDLSYATAVGVVVALRRQQAGLTQRELAAAIGVEYSTVSRIESGRITPTVVRMREIGVALCARFDAHLADEIKQRLEQFGEPRGDIAAVIASDRVAGLQRHRRTASGILDDAERLLVRLAGEYVADGLAVSQRSMIAVAALMLDGPPAEEVQP